MALGEYRHKRSKAAAAWRRELQSTVRSHRYGYGVRFRTVTIDVKVIRSFDYGAKGYRAEACFRRKSQDRQMRSVRCGYGAGNSPSKAVKNAVKAIGWSR